MAVLVHRNIRRPSVPTPCARGRWRFLTSWQPSSACANSWRRGELVPPRRVRCRLHGVLRGSRDTPLPSESAACFRSPEALSGCAESSTRPLRAKDASLPSAPSVAGALPRRRRNCRVSSPLLDSFFATRPPVPALPRTRLQTLRVHRSPCHGWPQTWPKKGLLKRGAFVRAAPASSPNRDLPRRVGAARCLRGRGLAAQGNARGLAGRRRAGGLREQS